MNIITNEKIDELISSGSITKRKHPKYDIYILNYTPEVQYSNEWTPELLMCRGLVVDSNANIVARPFEKFFNYIEENSITLPNEPYEVYLKMDGCLDESTLLETGDGIKTIKEICESKYKGGIKSFDIETNKVVFDRIINHSILENNDDWYEIELENGQTIKLTGNHKVWIPKLLCYRQVKDLNGLEEFLLE